MTRLFVAINGILTDPNSASAWNKLACPWLIGNGYAKPGDAVPFAYGVGAASGPVYDDMLAEDLLEDLLPVIDAGLEPTLLCHSNAVKIACIFLRLLLLARPKARVRLRLIASAENADCGVNGLNDAARAGQLIDVVFFTSPVDEVLGINEVSGIGMLLYGDLGKVGPHNVCLELRAVMTEIVHPMYHSEWVNEKFYQTMGECVRGAA